MPPSVLQEFLSLVLKLQDPDDLLTVLNRARAMDLWKQVLGTVETSKDYLATVAPLMARLMKPDCNRLGQRQDRMAIVGVTFNDRGFTSHVPDLLASANARQASEAVKALCWVTKEVLADKASSQPVQEYEERFLRLLQDEIAMIIVERQLPFAQTVSAVAFGDFTGGEEQEPSFRQQPSAIRLADIDAAMGLVAQPSVPPADLRPPLFGPCLELDDYVQSWFRLLRLDTAAPAAGALKAALAGDSHTTLFPHLQLCSEAFVDIPSALYADVGVRFTFEVHDTHPQKRNIERCRHDADQRDDTNTAKARQSAKAFFTTVLKRGSLVGLIDEGGELARLAVVSDNLKCYKGEVALKFPDPFDLQTVLAEFAAGKARTPRYKLLHLSSSYFNHLPVIRRLQQMYILPFERTLLAPGSTPPQPPQYFGDTSAERNMDRLENATRLLGTNERQIDAVRYAFQNEVAIIQGPPGTGKTFVGMVICKHVLEVMDGGKILCVCKTNHAVDAFMELLVHQGLIDPKDGSVVRIGGKSASAMLEPAGIYSTNLKKKAAESMTSGQWDRIKDLRARQSELKAALCRQENIIKDCMCGVPFAELRYLLDADEVRQLDLPVIEDGFQVVQADGRATDLSPDFLWKLWLDGKPLPQAWSTAAGPLWRLSMAQRLVRHQQLLIRHTQDARLSLADKLERMQHLRREEDQLKSSGIRVLLEGAKVIACTSWGAAQHAELLDNVAITTVVIEEAAELLEPSVISAIPTNSCKHLVLIGDHQQLRPRVETYQLTVAARTGLDLNRSMFERLFYSRLEHITLSTQHRMRPEISQLSRALFYPTLIDADSVLRYPDVTGLGRNLMFVDTPFGQDATQQEPSPRAKKQKDAARGKKLHRNADEAALIGATVRYLVSSGHMPEDMAVLTPYSAQLLLLRTEVQKSRKVETYIGALDEDELLELGFIQDARELRNSDDRTSSVRVSTIDNFQGEEANIVLVSLTRSNKWGDIGFLKERERVNVLLSRAKHGMVLFGNRATLIQTPLWNDVLHEFEAADNLFPHLVFECARHGLNNVDISDPHSIPEDGCGKACGAELPCGHQCKKSCHTSDPDHRTLQYACSEKVYARCAAAGHFLLTECCTVTIESRASDVKVVSPAHCQDCKEISSAVQHLKRLTEEFEASKSAAAARATREAVEEEQRYQEERIQLEKTAGAAAIRARLEALRQHHAENLSRQRQEQREQEKALKMELDVARREAGQEAKQVLADIERRKAQAQEEHKRELEAITKQREVDAMFCRDTARRETAALRAKHRGQRQKLQAEPVSLSPSYWLSIQPSQGRCYHLVDVPQEQLQLMQQFVMRDPGPLGWGRDHCLPGTYSRLEVSQVQRVQNDILWRHYFFHRNELANAQRVPSSAGPTKVKTEDTSWQKDLVSGANEVYLFHGTRPDTVPDICTHGFNERLAKTKGLYGAGVYFADQVGKSDQYATPDKEGYCHILLSRVSLGQLVLEDSAARTEKRMLPKVPGLDMYYTSLVARNPQKFAEYVLYNGVQAYPEFVIRYRRAKT